MANDKEASPSAEGEWHTVSARDKKRVIRKKGSLRTNRRGVAHSTAAIVESVSDVSTLGQILQGCRQALRQTQLYQEITSQIFVDAAFCPTEILCLGLGNFSRTHPTYFSASMWQLALLIQLREDLASSQRAKCNPKVYFYDPACTPPETAFLKQQQNIHVLAQDEQGKRQVAECTLVFMPHCPAILYENLFQANPRAFGPASSSSLLIGNSIRNFCDALSPSIDMPTLRARLQEGQLDERQLTVDNDDAQTPPGDFEKAFNDTFLVRGKTHPRNV